MAIQRYSRLYADMRARKFIPSLYLEIVVKILYMARYFILMLTARWWNLESCLMISISKASYLQNSCNFSPLLSLTSLKSVNEKTNFYWNNQYNFYITRKPNPSKFQRRKFSMPFGVTFSVAKYKYSIGSVQWFYFGFYKKDECNIFSFLEEKSRKKIIKSICNINAYPNESNG